MTNQQQKEQPDVPGPSRTHAQIINIYPREGEIKEGGVEETIQENHGGFEIPLLLATPEFLEAWQDWVEYRTDAGKKYRWATTSRCFRKSLEKCEKWGIQRSIAAIDHSIEYGYRGLFEPRQSLQPDVEIYKPGSSFRGRGG